MPNNTNNAQVTTSSNKCNITSIGMSSANVVLPTSNIIIEYIDLFHIFSPHFKVTPFLKSRNNLWLYLCVIQWRPKCNHILSFRNIQIAESKLDKSRKCTLPNKLQMEILITIYVFISTYCPDLSFRKPLKTKDFSPAESFISKNSKLPQERLFL